MTSEPSSLDFLTAMPVGEVQMAIDAIASEDDTRVGVVLTDGHTVVGHIRGDAFSALTADHLALVDNRLFDEHAIELPIDRIAGVYDFVLEQDPVERGPMAQRAPGAREQLDADLYDRSVSHAFRVTPLHRAYSLSHRGPIKWGPVSFQRDTPLYCDWSFLSQRAGGLNNVGAGFVVSLSAGWSKSLWSSFHKLVKKHPSDYLKICQRAEAMVTGYVTFLQGDTDDALVEKMDGAEWVPAIISEARPANGDLEEVGKWALAYF